MLLAAAFASAAMMLMIRYVLRDADVTRATMKIDTRAIDAAMMPFTCLR